MARTQIHQEISTIPVSIDKVWSLLRCFGSIKAWIPTIDSCSADGEDVGAVRNVYWSGNLMQEKLEVRDIETHTISYRLLDSPGLPMKGGRGTVVLNPKGENEAEITWTADAEEIDEAGIQTTKMIFEPFIRSSITSLRETLTRPAQPMF